MGLTPADVHNVAFKKPSIGKRGYDEDEVDAFLDLVEAELTRLIEADAGGTGHGGSNGTTVQLAKTAAEPTPAAPAAAPAEDGQPPHTQAARLLGLAQETADRLTSEARAESEALLADAQEKSTAMVTDAQEKSTAMVAEAQEKADTLTAKAAADAEATLADSTARAEALDSESTATYATRMGRLEAEEHTLQRTIDDLRSYEREYRTRLKAWIGEQLEQLDEVGATPAAGTAAAGSTDEAGAVVDADGTSDSSAAVTPADTVASAEDTDEAGALVDTNGTSDSAAAVAEAQVTATSGRTRR